jgi:hypothetical protein
MRVWVELPISGCTAVTNATRGLFASPLDIAKGGGLG